MKVMYFVSGRADKGISEAISKYLPGIPYSASQIPDCILIVGDRWEAFYAAASATLANIPIAHVHGGEISEGSNDDVFRHSITKMAQIHFVSNETHRRRVIQMGEHPDTVFIVGAPGLDGLEEYLSVSKSGRLVVTFHPVTRENYSAGQFRELLIALPEDKIVIFTGSNADAGGKQIDDLADQYEETHSNFHVRRTMTRHEYLLELAAADAIVGNSSSGIIEAPFLHTPTIDIGNRQKGRMVGDSVIHCQSDRESIRHALSILQDFKPSYLPQLYGDGHSGERIAGIMKEWKPFVKKQFFDIRW